MRYVKIIVLMFSVVGLATCDRGRISDEGQHAESTLDTKAGVEWDRRVATARKHPAYVVNRADWVRFPLPPNANRVRLFSNAALPAGTNLLEIEEVRYALEIQVLSLMKSVVSTKTHHLRSRVPLYVDEVSSDPYTGNFFHPREGLVPAGGKAIHLDLDEIDGASSIRLRLTSMDPRVRDAVVRVSSQQSVPERKLRYKWNRLGAEERKELAESTTMFGNPRLLSAEERRALVSRTWIPIGPAGVENRDYVRRVIYAAKREEKQKDYNPREAVGELVVTPERVVTIPVADGESEILVKALLLEGRRGDETLRISSFDAVTLKQKDEVLPFEEAEVSFTNVVHNRGLLEISSEQAKAKITVFQAGVEVTPNPTLIQAAEISQTGDIRYEIYPQEDGASYYRLDLRGLLGQEPLPETASVCYALLDAAGNELEAAELPIDFVPSAYDGLAEVPGEATVTVVQRYYLQPTEKATALVLSADSPILANLYTRPGGRRYLQRIPRDYVKTEEARRDKRRIWFPIQASELQLGQKRELALQSQRPESRLEEGADYQWTEFVPEGKWRSRTFFTPRGTAIPLREESYLSVYMPVPIGQRVAMRWLTPFGRSSIHPKLLYFGDQALSRAVSADVQINDSIAQTFPLTASHGEIALPEVNAGAGDFRVDLPKEFRAYVNYHELREGALLKRQVIRLDRNQSLTYAYSKESVGEEILTGRFYTDAETTEDTTLLVDLVASRSASSYALREHSTVTQRELIISPNHSGNTVEALHSGRQKFTEGQRFVFPIGSDIATTTMPLTITHVSGAPGYLQITRINPGLGRAVYVYREEIE